MGWKESFYEAVAEYLRELDYDAAEVYSVEQEEVKGGYCETCYYESIEVEVLYLTSSGDAKSFTYYGTMSDFMNGIT